MTFLFVLTALALSALIALRWPKTALLAAVFFIPWAGLDVDIGLRVTAYLVFIIPIFTIVLLRMSGSHGWRNGFSSLGVLNLLILYAIIWSLAQIPFLPEASVAGGGMRQPAIRSAVQIVMFLITLSPLLVVPALIRNAPDLVRLGKVYLTSTVVLALIGWVQLAIWFATGSDPLPVGFFDNLLGGSAANRSGMFSYEGQLIYRMSSFGGEPRDMGASLAVALLLLQSGIRMKASLKLPIWYFLFASMVATFSTMALLAWFCASAVQFFTTSDLRLKLHTQMLRIKRSVLFALLVALFAFVVVGFSGHSNLLTNLVEMRTLDRITENKSAYLEDFNAGITDFLLDQPLFSITGVGLGNVHLYANNYLTADVQDYAADTAFVAKSFSLKWISELGLLSFLIFSYWVVAALRKAASLERRVMELAAARGNIAKFGLPLFAFVLVSSYVIPQFFIMLGCALAICSIARREISLVKANHAIKAEARHF